jgi:putative tryptophan/tyrosine transport system substrate-binding protein
MNHRRKLVVALGGGVLTAPFGAFAQQPGKVWRVGFLAFPTRPSSLDSHVFGAFPRGMRELGYVEGKNLTLEWRFADGKPERLPELAAELVRLKVDVIVVSAGAASRAAQKATTTIPIIFAAVSDPVSSGLIKSLAQPGGNITGRTNITGELGPKHFELLLAMVPKVSRMAVLMTSTGTANTGTAESIQAAGQKRRVTVVRVDAGTPQEIETAFSTMVREKAGALIVSLNPFFFQQRIQIAELAAKHRLPCITGDRMYVEAGCLMSYGASLADDFHRLATYVDKIFKGAKPSDLPVEQPTKFELIINGKTAKTLGLTIPPELLAQADKVIE